MSKSRHRLLPALVGLVCLLGLGCKSVLVHIGFVDAGAGAGGDNEQVIYQNSAGHQGWGDGAAITDPVWVAGGRNEPVCYVRSKPGAPSRLKVEVTLKAGKGQFNLVGYDGATTYFRKDGLTATGENQTVAMVAEVDLPGTVSVLQKTFKWKRETVGGSATGTEDLGSSTHKIYVIFDRPVATVEGQSNKLTPKRLDFAVGAADGESSKVDVAHAIAAKTAKKINGSYGWMPESPRWLAYSRSLNLDCHHRAALAASAMGIVGIEGHVHKAFATIHPVPPYTWGNPTVNDYVSAYSGDRLKHRVSGCTQKLMFKGNNFEGNLRIEDGSADDGNQWWTIWPFKKHATARDLLQWYAATGYQYWSSLGSCSDGSKVPVPTAQVANKPKILGGPN